MSDIKVNRVNRNFTIKVHLYFNPDSYNRDEDSTPRYYLKPIELLYVERAAFTDKGGRNNNYLKQGNRFWKNKPDLALTDEQCETIFEEIKKSYPYGYDAADAASKTKYNLDVKKNEAFQSFYHNYWNNNLDKVTKNTIHNVDGTKKYPYSYIEFNTEEIITYKYTSGTIPALPTGISLDYKYTSGESTYYAAPINVACHDGDAGVTFDSIDTNHFVVDGQARWPMTLSASGRYRFDLNSGSLPYTLWPTGADGSYVSKPFRFSSGNDGSNAGYSEYTNGVSYVVSPQKGYFYTKIVTKTQSTGPGEDGHYYMYSGHASGYAVSGSGDAGATGVNVSGFGYDEGPIITLRRDSTYRFVQDDISNSGHPILISTHGSGQDHQTYTSGIYSKTSHPAWLEFEVPATAPDRLYYTCTNHAYMGGPLNIIDAPAAPKTGSIPGESIILDNNLSTGSGLFYYCSGVTGIGNFVELTTGCGTTLFSGVEYIP